MKHYPSKLLLFGEYTVIQGSQALAMPFDKFSGSWQYSGDAMNLIGLANYLDDLQAQNKLLVPLDITAFKAALQKGLYFKSDIPTGYGLGSSGALCAAVYNVFATTKAADNLDLLKKQLAQIESFFHGASSGIDPLVCYLNQPILVREDKSISKIDWQVSATNSLTFFLIDTQISRKTEPFVTLYKERCKDDLYTQRLEAELIPLNDNAIHAFLHQEGLPLFEMMHLISHFQYKYFDAMILDNFKELWLDSLASDFYKLKLCGAGGGGMMLGFTTDFEKTKIHLKDYRLIEVLHF